MPAHSSTDVPDVITVGRVSVDLYAEEVNASFTDPQTFRKSIGGSPTNVAVAAASARGGLAPPNAACSDSITSPVKREATYFMSDAERERCSRFATDAHSRAMASSSRDISRALEACSLVLTPFSRPPPLPADHSPPSGQGMPPAPR